jgi:hypothetical protein
MVHTDTTKRQGEERNGIHPDSTASFSRSPHRRLLDVLRYQHVESKHLKIGRYEYVEIKRIAGSKDIYVERSFRSRPGTNLQSQSFWFSPGEAGPRFCLGRRLPDIEKLLSRIEQGEDHYECLCNLSLAKRHRYRLEHPESFSAEEYRLDKAFRYIWMAKEVSSVIRDLAKDSRLIRPGFQDLTETLIDSFMDALYLSWQLDVSLSKLNHEQKATNRKYASLYHYPFDVGGLTHTVGPLNQAVQSILNQLEVMQPAATESKELQILSTAAYAIQSASELFLESRQYTYSYSFRALLGPQNAQQCEERLRDGDVLELRDGRRMIVVISPKIDNEGYRPTAQIQGIVIYPSGVVQEETVTFHADESCQVIRSDRPWALDDQRRRFLVTGGERGAGRVELIGRDLNDKPYYVFWSGRNPFYEDSVKWVDKQLSEKRFASFPVPKLDTLLDAFRVRGFPANLLFSDTIQWGRPTDAKLDSALKLEAAPALEGLEHLCQLIQSSDIPTYLHVCGTPFNNEGFSACRISNGVIVTPESEERLKNLKENSVQKFVSKDLPMLVPETLARYPVTPILVVTRDAGSCEHDIKLARAHGWKIVFFNDLEGGAGRYIQELMPLIRSHGEQVLVIKRTQAALRDAITRITRAASINRSARYLSAPSLSAPINRAAAPVTATNSWVREFDQLAHSFERSLCDEIVPVVVSSEQQTKLAAHALRTIHKSLKAIRRGLLFTDLDLAEWLPQPSTIEGLIAALSVLPKGMVDTYIKKISLAVHDLRSIAEPSRGADTTFNKASIGMDTVVTGRDLVRISQIMESGRNDIFGPAGSLHGMMYGDMSPQRFATFFNEGCSLVSFRDAESGTIQGFILNYPKWATLKLKSESAQALSSVESTRVIAISIDLGFKSQEPQLYAKLVRTFLLHQIRDGVDIMHMRVHPRNLKASVPHMTTAGFLPTSVADEWVDGQRFVTMFHDIGAYCDDPTKISALRLNEAVQVAWSLYMEEYPGRDPQQNKSQEFAAELSKLIDARIKAWKGIEEVLASDMAPSDALRSICERLRDGMLQVKAERRMEVESILELISGSHEWPENVLESLQSALILALNSRDTLERDRATLDRYLKLDD